VTWPDRWPIPPGGASSRRGWSWNRPPEDARSSSAWRPGRWAACLAVALLAVGPLWLASDAAARPHRGSGGTAPAGKGGTEAGKGGTPAGKGGHSQNPHGNEPQGGAGEQFFSPEELGGSTLGKSLGESGQVDPISGLGLRNPICDRISEIRSRETRMSCEASGTPESNYPSTNYGFDIFIDTGVDAPEGTFAKGFVMILNGIWLGLIFVLKLVLEVLGLAFGLNPFSGGRTMHTIAATLERVYRAITDPWLSVAVVAGGISFAYKGLVRREMAAGVGGTLAAIAMLVVVLWVVHQPRESVGRLADISNQMAIATISAPQPGSMSRPMGTFAEALTRTWSRLVEVPFAGLNFSDAQWALGKPPPKAVSIADQKFCEDVGALAMVASLAHLGSEEAQKACTEFAHKRYGKPQRVIDLYLRSSPGSPARQALWQYFDHEEADKYKSKVAAQGGDGVLTRLSMLALFAVGLLGPILLLAWLAVRLFTQAAIAFLLLLAAPFALFFPLLGDSGRRAFKTWGVTLLGAIVAKVVYGAFLSLVLLGAGILGATGGATGFLLAAVFMWSVYLKRSELVGWMRIGGGSDPRGSFTRMGEVAGVALGARMVGSVTGALRGARRRGASSVRRGLGEGADPTSATLKESLSEHALGVADFRHTGGGRSAAARDGGSSRGTAANATTAARLASTRAAEPAVRSDGASRGAGRAAEPAAPGESTAALAAAGRRSSAAPRSGAGSAPRSAGERPDQVKRPDSSTVGGERVKNKVERPQIDRDPGRFSREERQPARPSGDPADQLRRGGFTGPKFEQAPGQGGEMQRNGGKQGKAGHQAIEKVQKTVKQGNGHDGAPAAAGSKAPARVVGRGRSAVDGIRGIKHGAAPDRRADLEQLRRKPRDPRLTTPRHGSRGGR
jgi:hypothetical protein